MRILSKVKRRLEILWKNIILSLVQGKITCVSNKNFHLISASDLFQKHKMLDVNQFVALWEKANLLDSNGDFRNATKLRANCLQEIERIQKINDHHIPPFIMSNGWVHSLGHIAFLAFFSLAQHYNLVPNNQRYIVVKNVEEFKNVTQLFPNQFIPLVRKNPNRFDGNDGNIFNWHFLEHLLINRSSAGFETPYQLLENVMQLSIKAGEFRALVLPPEKILQGREFLKKIGLPAGSWFAALHIRENSFEHDARKVSIQNYLLAVNEIVRSGGHVIRFGTGKMTPLPQISNLIDLNLDTPQYRDHHLFLISSARFVLTTHSGPGEIARAFGVPTIITNAVTPAKAFMTGHPGSVYLPKTWKLNGRLLNYETLMSGLEGYSERNLSYRARLGYSLIENTEIEIREAVLDFLFSRESVHESGIVSTLNKELNVLGKGRIAPSYLVKNSNWFLDA